MVALTTRPPRTTWFHPSPKSICPAEGLARWAFGAAGWPTATLFRLRSGACFATAAFASFHFTHPRYFAVWLPRSHSTEAVVAGKSIHRRGGSPHRGRTGAHIRSYTACVRSAGSACIEPVHHNSQTIYIPQLHLTRTTKSSVQFEVAVM